MNKKILITGGRGLVGSEFVGEQFYKPTSNEFNLIDYNKTNELLSKGFDGVIHSAAMVGGVGRNMKLKGEFFFKNIMMNTNVIESARVYGVKKLVSFLSTCIFPDEIDFPLTESKIHLGPPHFSNDAYAYSKRMLDIQIKAYNEQYGLKYTSVIPTNIYGPNDNYDIENGHVIPSLIHKCFLARENNKDFTIWGSGRPIREFIHSKDVAKLTEWVLENYEETEPIILSTSYGISIKELVDIITEIMNFKGKVIFDSTKPDGQLRKPTDNTKLKNLIPDYKFIDIYDGLKDAVEFFEKNYQTVRKSYD
jgi:GDP-L-fucose synthase